MRGGKLVVELYEPSKDGKEFKSLEIIWIDGTTNVEVMCYGKGNRKSQVTVQHNKLASSAETERKTKYGAEQLERLQKYLNE